MSVTNKVKGTTENQIPPPASIEDTCVALLNRVRVWNGCSEVEVPS